VDASKKLHSIQQRFLGVSQMIAIFLPDLSGGGAERVMLNLAQGFADRGLEVEVVLAKARGPYLRFVPDGVRIIDLNANRVRASIPKLIRYLRNRQPEVLVSALEHANVAAVLARKFGRVPVKTVVTVHMTLSHSFRHMPFWKRTLFRPLIRFAYGRADHVVCVSRGVAEDTREILQLTQIPLVIYNPVITENFHARARERVDDEWFNSINVPVVLAVGRLTKLKDFLTLIKAFGLVRAQMPAKLIILGEGEERERIEESIRALQLEHDVFLPGFRENPYAFLNRSAVFVMSSTREALPTVLIEALALGIPIVSTDCEHGPREILDDGLLGHLVPVGDAPRMAQGIMQALSSSAVRQNGSTLEQFTVGGAAVRYLSALGVEH
jgi:glycosyltransferase involved in cell wall biosynthesis